MSSYIDLRRHYGMEDPDEKSEDTSIYEILEKSPVTTEELKAFILGKISLSDLPSDTNPSQA